MRSGAHRRSGLRFKLAVIASLCMIAWLAASPGLERRDGRLLVLVNGVPLDLLGMASEYRQRLTSDCSQVAELSADAVEVESLLGVIRAFSPPDSLTASLHGVYATGKWRVVEASFDRLPPAWIVLHQAAADSKVPEVRAVWSGSTFPWRAMPFAGAYLQVQLPDVPPALLRCGRLRLW